MLVTSCAHVVKPTGGEKDTKGPVVIAEIPSNQTKEFWSEEVTFYFDEFLKPGNYRDEIFVSPVQEIQPEILVKNKTLKIRFKDKLRANTTYVITLGTGIKDFNEGNKMSGPFTYAFTTGDVLDSLSIKGNITDFMTSSGAKDMTVLLYPEESIEGNQIFEKKPVYVTQTDDNGQFSFEYLAEGRYKIYAVEDKNKDFCYSMTSEKIAIAENPEIDLSDSLDRSKIYRMFAFRIDQDPPRVKSVKWINDYAFLAEFSETVSDSIRISLSDTNGNDKRQPGNIFFNESRTRVTVEFQHPHKDLKVSFGQFSDSLGNRADTAVKLINDLYVKELKNKWFEKPVVQPESKEILIRSMFVLPEQDSSMVRLRDSSDQEVPFTLKVKGFEIRIALEDHLTPGIPYKLELGSKLKLPGGSMLDSLFKYTITYPNPDNFGSVSGEIMPDSLNPEMKIVVIILEKGKKGMVEYKRLYGPGKYRIDFMKPGSYSLKVIGDKDGNGVLSPGSLDPYVLPESVYIDPNKLEIKEKWELEDYNIFFKRAKDVKKKGGKEKK